VNKVKTLIITLTLCCMFSPAVSAELSGGDCRKAAENFLSYIGSDKEIVSVKNLEKDGETVGYVMILGQGGYVLVSGSESLVPIKSYSLTCPFDTLPEWYKNILTNELGAVNHPEYRENIRNENHDRWDFLLSYEKTRTSPRYAKDTFLLKTQWNQFPIYNKFLPEINGERVVTGCVQTALGQIMKYHKHPEKAAGILRHTWNNQKLKTVLYKNYNWDNMPDVVDSSSPEYMQDEVAALMRDLGIADRANFGIDETSASLNITALLENFGYSTELDIMRNDNAEFFNTIKSEIDNSRPVALNFPGHATVADGYASDPTGKKIHVNMGWGGHYDDFYFLNDTVNAGPYSFAPDLEIIHHIKPCEGKNCYNEIIRAESPPDAINGSKITGNFYALEDADIYSTFLKGTTEISGNRGYTSQAFYILVYAANDEIVASDDKTIKLDLPAGKYWIKAALVNEKGAYYSYDAKTDYTVTISTGTVTDEEKAQIAAYDSTPVINNDFSDIILTETRKIRIDASDEDYRDEISLRAESSDSDVAASIEGNILTLTPVAAKGHSKITVIATSREKSVQKSFDAVVSDEPIYFGKKFVINGTFGKQDQFDKYKAIMDGQCSITGYNGYSNQAFFTSILDAANGTTYLVPMGDKLIEYKAENKLYLIGASLKKYPGTAQYPYAMGKGDKYSLTVSCPDSDPAISDIAKLLGIDFTTSSDSVPVVTGLSDDSSPVKTKVWKWDATSENSPATFRYQIDQNKTWTPSGAYSDIETVSKSSNTGGIWYLHVQAKDAKGNESSVTTVSTVLIAVTVPENDNFAKAVVLTGESGQKTGSNTDATKEPSEPDHAGNKGGQSVWWKWTATESTYFSFDTEGSNFDTMLAVYTGTSVDLLTEVGSNNDIESKGIGDTDNNKASRVIFHAEKDKVYYIAVDGYGLTSGNITLNWKKDISGGDNFNDNFANAAKLSEESGTTTASNANATTEFGEPNHAENIGGKSIWYSWIAPNVKDDYSGYFSFDTQGSTFDTLLAVYTGTAPNNLKIVEFNDNDGSTSNNSSLTFRAQTGTRYYIAVDGKNGASGNVVLNWQRLAASGADNFADAKDMQWMAIASNVNATKETGEPNHAGNTGGKSLWWKGTAIEDGWFAFDTHGSDFDTLLSVYTGSDVAALTKIAENDNDMNDGTSGMTFHVENGKTYYFAVDGNEGASGNIILKWRFAYPPANDNFANATALSATLPGKITGLNADATKESGEPDHAENIGGKSLWWKLTAPQTGTRYAFDTHGSDFDTTLAVYTGSGVNSLTEIASNDDDKLDGNSGLSFAVEPGKEYYIAVDGYMGISGNIVLNWRLATPPANDNFSNAVVLESEKGKVAGSNTDATEETGEPNHSNLDETYSDRYGNTSVWWKWTAPKKDRFAFNVEGSEKFYKLIGVYTGSSLGSLKEVVSNSGEDYRNFVTFDAEAAETYYIAVDGYQGGAGMILLSWTITPPGDADGSGAIDLKDALLILKVIIGADTGSNTPNLTADINGDGKLGLEELMYILRYAASKP
jgi:hypothetical protein